MKIIYSLITVIIFITFFVVITIMGDSAPISIMAFAPSDKFITKLLGNNEVPPIHSKAKGITKFVVIMDGIKFKVRIKIKGATMSHIHLVKQRHFTKNVVAMLFTFKSTKNHVSEKSCFRKLCDYRKNVRWILQRALFI